MVKTARAKPSVCFDVPEDLTVLGARGAIHQILVNLIQNSLDAMAGQDAPKVEIGARRTGDWVAVTVRDHGPGIPPETMKKLFEPFFTTKPIGKGLGLGLYVSYGLAEDIGGKLSAANHREGGAEFTLRIPRTVDRHAP